MNVRRWLLLIVVSGLAATLLASSWVFVAPGEAVVIRRLGRVLEQPLTPGAHLTWPLGIDRADRVKIGEVRRLAISPGGMASASDAPGAGEYLSGDLNLLRVGAVVQYQITDPAAFLFSSEAVEPLLSRIGESSLSTALARRSVDAALGVERVAIASEVVRRIADDLDDFRLGVTILGVSLTEVRPPPEVQPDFTAAQSAQSERDRRVQEAIAYADATLPKARATAAARIERAHAVADRRIALATSEAGRFLDLLVEVDRARSLTVRRLYQETLSGLLPRVRRKMLLTPEEPLDLSVLGARP